MGIIYAIMTTQSGESVAQRRVGKKKMKKGWIVCLSHHTILLGYLICTLFLNKPNDLSIMLINTLQRVSNGSSSSRTLTRFYALGSQKSELLGYMCCIECALLLGSFGNGWPSFGPRHEDNGILQVR
jgi:hypothetical protein